MGFVVENEAQVDNQSLSSFKNFADSFKTEGLPISINSTKTQATWLLRVADTTTQ